MSDSFSLSPSQCAETSDPALRMKITDHTHSETATFGILRSIERFGADTSIERFDISRSERGRYASKNNAAGWIVRAVRAGPPNRD